ncbi:MAG TPA: hypothetical protein VFJ17_13930 [Mycobacteriales bacterium]|jgi:hypothetical protein|nr:hypothetical protein [Mycobacteriales bacterium]
MGKRIVIALVAIVVVVGIVLGGWAIFEHFDRAGKIKDAGKACGGLDVVKGTPTVPAGFTLPDGERLLEVQSQGKTQIVYASTDGGRNDIVHVRDQVTQALTADGYKVTHTDQEPTYEAEATVSKNGTDDTVQVQPLCSGRLRVRFILH